MLSLVLLLAAYAEEPQSTTGELPATPPAVEAAPAPCPPWFVDWTDKLCVNAKPDPRPDDAKRLRAHLHLADAGLGVSAGGVPLYVSFAAGSIGTPELALAGAFPSSGVGLSGTIMSTVGLERAARLLERRGVTLSPVPRLLGATFGAAAFVVEAAGAIGWGTQRTQPYESVILAATGAGLQTTSLVFLGVADGQTRKALHLIEATDGTQGQVRPVPKRRLVRLAPHVDLTTHTIGLSGVW